MTLAYSLDISSLARAYASGALTPARVVSDIRAGIAATGTSPVWIHLVEGKELEAAVDLVERARAGGATLPLYGIPFAVKDNIDVAGLPTTAGCPEFASVPSRTAQCVRRLQDAGAILIGKTNLDQFATGLTGTRSPYGACVNPFDPRYIAGGSSSGSAVAVATGLASFALGTDTAGSGRVPAAFNGIVGLKPTRGVIGASGVVPACRSLDCVSILALSCDDACAAFDAARGADPHDPWSRTVPPGALSAATGTNLRFGVPRDPQFFGDDAAREHFERALALIRGLGAATIPFDYAPFAEAARLLYEGPWVAERFAAIKGFVRERPDALLPVTRSIIERGAQYSAVEAFEAAYRLQALKRQCDDVLAGVDALLLPTAPTIYTLAEIAASPLELNRNLGVYTNFVNLLDYCAVAAPAGLRRDGLPAGVTFVAQPFSEYALLEYADRLQRAAGAPLGATGHPLPAARTAASEPSGIVLAVVGAHLSGLPLNHQLTARGARLIGAALTAPAYRLYDLPGAEPRKPGLVRTDNGHGEAIEVELWSLAPAEFGSFVAGIPAPLGIGSVALADGRQVKGFLCEQYTVSGARDISGFGGWREITERDGRNTMKLVARSNLAAVVYERLKADIFDFRLLPGDRFTETEVAAQSGVSRTPVREALYKLEREGYILLSSRNGWSVNPFDFESFESLYDVRVILELAAAQKVCETADGPGFEELERVWLVPPERRVREPQKVCDLDERFHAALVGATGNAQLARIHHDITERIRIIRRLDFTQPDRIDSTYDEHAQILRAVMRRRLDQSRLLLKSHIEASKSVVRRITLHRLHSARTLLEAKRARTA